MVMLTGVMALVCYYSNAVITVLSYNNGYYDIV